MNPMTENTSTESAATGPREVRRWSVEMLRALMPGTSRDAWRYTLCPLLERQGVLRRVGKLWHGRRADIEAALYPQAALQP
jgi:hypothetical protein